MIKSKKANQFLHDSVINSIDLGPDSYSYMLMEDVEEAVELAESELYSEEQCIEAFKKACSCSHGNGIGNVCKDYAQCKRYEVFLSTLKSKQ